MSHYAVVGIKGHAESVDAMEGMKHVHPFVCQSGQSFQCEDVPHFVTTHRRVPEGRHIITVLL